MRILLDESLPRPLVQALTGHTVETVQRRGWAGLKNGVLLREAAEHFDVLVTGDRNMQYQQNRAALAIPVIVLVAANNRIESLLPLVPRLLQTLETIQPGQVVEVAL